MTRVAFGRCNFYYYNILHKTHEINSGSSLAALCIECHLELTVKRKFLDCGDEEVFLEEFDYVKDAV